MDNVKENEEKRIKSTEVETFLPDKTDKESDRKDEKRKKSFSLLIGVTVTFTVCVFDTTSIACLQLMDQLPPDLQISAVNFTFGLLCITPYFALKRKLPKFKKNRLVWVIVICTVFVVDCLTLYNHEASFLPLGSIGSIGYAFNIIFSVILSKIFLTELMTIHKGVALVITLLGLILTVLAHVPSLGTSYYKEATCDSIVPNDNQHNFSALPNDTETVNSSAMLDTTQITEYQVSTNECALFNHTETTSCNSGPKIQKDLWSEVLSMSLLAISCFCSASETVILSGSRLKKESPTTLAFWIFASGSIVLFPASFIFEQPLFPKSWTDRAYLLFYCMCSSGLSYCYIIAAQLLMPMFLTIIESFGVPLMFIVQMLFLTQIAKPNNIWLQTAGVLLVFLATIALPIIEYMTVKKQEKRQQNNSTKETKI